MKNTSKILSLLLIIALFGAFALTAEATNKSRTFNTKKSHTVVVKKPQPTKKQAAPIKQKTPIVKKETKQPVLPTPTTPQTLSYPWHNDVLATQFYIGETGLNGTTAWDCHAVSHYGGIDSPFNRNNYLPTFTPKENPFYLALPYTDIGPDGAHKTEIPWYDSKLDAGDGYSFVKNRWVEIKRGDKTCYGQWEDSLTPDIVDPATGKRTGYDKPIYFDYVFGTAPATRPGIDVSPALSDCLGMDDKTDTVFGHSDGLVSWRFVNENEVPNGAWKNIITATPVSWENCK